MHALSVLGWSLRTIGKPGEVSFTTPTWAAASHSGCGLNIQNESSFEAHGLNVKLSQPADRPIKAAEQQTLVLPRIPDALVHQRTISLEGKANVFVLVADADAIAQLIGQSRPGWCLYDVGVRADNADSDGYQEAMEANLREREARSTYDPEPWVSSTLSIAVALTVQYVDLFEIVHEFPAVGFLRVADPQPPFF